MSEDRLFYAPARPGCRRIEDDARAVTQEGGTADPPVRRPPAGMLVAATEETAALEALRADEAEANAPATMIEVTAEEAASRFGPQAVTAVRRMARRERSAATPRSLREWAAAELRKVRAAARATAPGERWMSTTAESETLAAAYVREGEPPGIRLYATAPCHPWLHTCATALALPAERAPTIRTESLGADGTRVLIDNVETRIQVRDLATTVAVAASQASGLRAGPVGVRVLEQAGRILENGNGRAPGSLRLTTRSARCLEPCVEEGWTELLVTLLTRQAGLRNQQGADAYGETRPWELDVEMTGREPAVLRGDTATATLLTEAGERSLNERAARPIRAVAERIQARSGADEFWIDADTRRSRACARPDRTGVDGPCRSVRLPARLLGPAVSSLAAGRRGRGCRPARRPNVRIANAERPPEGVPVKKIEGEAMKRFAQLYPGETAEATEARLEAAAWCAHLDGCAAAREHLAGRATAAAGPRIVLGEDDRGRLARLETGTDDETVVRTEAELDQHLRGLPETVMVRRDGWTLPERDGRVEADRACLLLSGNGPTVQVSAEIGMDGQLVNAILEYVDAAGLECRFRAGDHDMSGAGVEELANVHRLPGGRR